jgi:hypothetical protein
VNQFQRTQGLFKKPVIIVLSASLSACGGGDDANEISITERIDDSIAVNLSIGPAMGEEEVFVPIRGVNQHNAAVPNVETTLSIDGQDLSNNGTSIQTGAWGIHELRLWGTAAQHIKITAPDFESTEGVPPEGSAWLLPDAFDPQSLSPAHTLMGPPTQIASTDGATLYSVGSEIYWQPHDLNAMAQHSASLNGGALGLLWDDLDSDGHPDAVAWSESEVILLRGSSLGLVWGGGYAMVVGSILDVATNPVDQDNFSDLAIAYSNGDSPGIQVLLNDGAWGFEPTARLPLAYKPESITIGNFLGNETYEIAVLQDETISRYRYESEDNNWLNSGQDLKPEPGFGPGSELGMAEDISGEGADELFIVEAPVENGERRLAFYELIHERPLIYDLRFEANEYTLADATGDGVPDVLVLQDDGEGRAELRALTSDVEGEDPYRNRSFSTLTRVGHLGVSDHNSDGVADISVTDEAIRHHEGRVPEDGFWAMADPGIGGWDMNIAGGAMLIDANNDGKKLDLLVIRDTDGETALWSYTFDGGANGSTLNLVKNATYLRSLDDKNGAARATFLDWDLCDSDGQFIYMLVNDGGRRLFVTKVQTNGSVPGRADVAVQADLVTCGNFANGAKVAAVSLEGDVYYYDDALNPMGTENIGPLSDVVAADLDGNGAQLVPCSGDCSLAAADTDNDGIDEVAQGGANPQLTGWGKIQTLATFGTPSFSDVDGNGTLDLVITSPRSGHFQVHPILQSGGLSPGFAWHTRQPLMGDVIGGDVDSDGLAEFFLVSADGDLLFASQD